MTLAGLAWKSLRNRLGMVLLTIACIAFSVCLLIGVEKVRDGAKAGFAGTVAGVDLIVGARTGSVQLMLNSVFRIGEATANISWESYQDLLRRDAVSWAIPISLGDSHRGYRVIGTDQTYFTHYRYRDDEPLVFAEGAAFADLFDVVLGSAVAERLGYEIGDALLLNHGLGSVALSEHGDLPFRVSGVLAHTGTPVDKALHVSLEAIEAIHVDWQGGGMPTGAHSPAETIRQMDLTPTSVTAALVKLNSPLGIFSTQRSINQASGEALSAVIPGMALLELWSVVEVVETALRLVTILMVVTTIGGMMATMIAMLNDRRREMAILRALGARPGQIGALLMLEAGMIGALGAMLGIGMAYGGLALGGGWVEANYGLALMVEPPGLADLQVLALIVVFATLAGLVPAILAYRNSLADGIAIKT
jgi:putative ABC transport system permease protein